MEHWLTCLTNLKSELKETTTTFDRYLEALIQQASEAIEQYTGRKLRERTYGADGLDAEYHDGDGSRAVYTLEYPIISVTSLYDDIDNNYSSTTLFAPADYHVFKESGRILLLSDATLGSVFQVGRANIKIVYTAGYGIFEIISGRNDKIDFKEADSGSQLTATLIAGIYTAAGLATEIKTQMDTVGGTYTVTYDRRESKFTIKRTDSVYLSLLWNSGTNAKTNIGMTLGYYVNADDTGFSSYTSDSGVLGIPESLERACILICKRAFYESKQSRDRFDIDSESASTQGATTIKYIGGAIPPEAEHILQSFRRPTL